MTSSPPTDQRDMTTLWLPLSARAPVWIAAALVGAVYLLTMSRDLSFYDSAEFAAVAWQGGLSHPPGHPLHTILGWLMAHLPLVPTLIGLNALSALPAALAIVPVCSLAQTMARRARPSAEETSPPRWLDPRYVVPTIVALFALHPALWETASRIEVYALAGLLSLWALARLAALIPAETKEGPVKPRRWLAPGVALGLSASANPVVATITALAIAPALVMSVIRRQVRPAAGLWLIGGGVAGLVPYLYIPLVAGRDDALVWGAPTGGEALERYLTGADFAHNQGASWSLIGEHALEWTLWATERGMLPLLLLGLIAHVLWGAKSGTGRALGIISVGLTVLFLSMNVIFYPQVTDYLGYLMAPLSILGAGVAVLLVRLGASSVNKSRRGALAGLLAVVLALSVLLATPSPLGRTRHHDRVARVLAEGALENAPRDAIIIVDSDHWVFPMIYIQEVEGTRPDVVVLPRGLSGASWYWAHIFQLHQDLESFELRGPGGQPARIRRFMAANPGRPVLYEAWYEATSIGRRPACAGPWLLHDESACPDGTEAISDELTVALDEAIAAVGQGSPTTDAVIANVSLIRGVTLWRLGHPDRALRALRAGVPRELRPALSDAAATVDGAPPLTQPTPSFRDAPAIGHFSQNLFLAAHLLALAGAEQDAQAHMVAAARAGLPEALIMIGAP